MSATSPNASRIKLLVENTLARGGSTIFSQLLTLATLPLLLTAVGTADYGVYALTLALSGYLSVVALSARRALVKYVSEQSNQPDPETLLGVVNTSLAINVAIGVVICLCLLAVRNNLEAFGVAPDSMAVAYNAVSILVVSAPVLQVLTTAESMLLGMQRMAFVSVLDVARAIARALVIVAIFFLDGTITWLVASEAVVGLITTAAAAGMVKRHWGFLRLSFRHVTSFECKRLLRFGSWALIFSIGFQGVSQGSTVLLGAVAGVHAVTVFDVARKLFNLFFTIASLSTYALTPAISSAVADGEHRFVERVVKLSTVLLVALIQAVVVNVIAYNHLILEHWLGADIAAAASTSSRILVSAWFIYGCSYAVFASYWGAGSPRSLALWCVALAALHTALAPALAAAFGVEGFATSMLVFYALLGVVQMKVGLQALHIKFDRDFARSLLILSAIAVALLAGVSMPLVLGWNPRSLVATLSAFVFSTACSAFVLLAVVCRLDDDARKQLATFRDRLKRARAATADRPTSA